jgi:hypothetical protein
MANPKKQYKKLKRKTNWDSVILLSLTEIADKVLRESNIVADAESRRFRRRATGWIFLQPQKWMGAA